MNHVHNEANDQAAGVDGGAGVAGEGENVFVVPPDGGEDDGDSQYDKPLAEGRKARIDKLLRESFSSSELSDISIGEFEKYFELEAEGDKELVKDGTSGSESSTPAALCVPSLLSPPPRAPPMPTGEDNKNRIIRSTGVSRAIQWYLSLIHI